MAAFSHSSRKQPRTYQVIDPRTMGRPVHLLGKYTERLRKDLDELVHLRFNRRYRAQFEIGALSFEPAAPDLSRRWLTFGSEVGRVAFAADRSVLLCILDYRYGVAPSERLGIGASSDHETATEERLAWRLGGQFVTTAAAAIDALHGEQQEAQPLPEFTPVLTQLGDSAWTLRVSVKERSHGLEGSLWFRFDEPWIERLMRALAPHRERNAPRGAAGAATRPLTAQLQLTLSARLVDKEIDLGTLLDLRVGDVIPITLASTDVLIDDARLFTASIAEHKGKLCLTCFEAVE
jgi:flagellar motor switch protein FliM